LQGSIARPIAVPIGVLPATAKVQRLPRVSSPQDRDEVEARRLAREVTSSSAAPSSAISAQSHAGIVQRAVAPAVTASLSHTIPSLPGAGTPLPMSLQVDMGARLGANFSRVRIHTGGQAAQNAARLDAVAYTQREHIVFGTNSYQPGSPAGRELIAHELVHTIQQGASPRIQAASPVKAQVSPRVQRAEGVMGAVLNKLGEWANVLPGFRMLTLLLGSNPISGATVVASGANIIRAVLEMLPLVGALIVRALDQYGVIDKAGTWFEGRVKTLSSLLAAIVPGLRRFLDEVPFEDKINPFKWSGLWDRAVPIFERPIKNITSFVSSTVDGILRFVREAVLIPLGRMAEGTRGYNLLRTLLGSDPVTGEVVPRTAANLIGGFMTFIGKEEIWQNIQNANASARALTWFEQASAGLKTLVRTIPPRFMAAIEALDVSSLLAIKDSFGKLVSIFLDAVDQFFTWAGNAAWSLLEIIFDVVSPGALVYIKKTGSAIKSIFENPMPFMRNLIGAAKLGFQNFSNNFLTYLQRGLIEWLTGAMPGVHIPTALTLGEIAKFALSVLGISWANVRIKLVRAIGNTAVVALETGFDMVKTLVTGGVSALWERIKEQLTNLKDMAVGAISDFVVDMVVTRAIPKLLSMFIPGAGFISAIISIYDSIMVIVQRISSIIQVVTAFLDSVVAIAAGNISAAAARVESVLAGVMSLAINFFAAFLGLGRVADKIMGVLGKVRAVVDKAIDWVVGRIVALGRNVLARVTGRHNETPAQQQNRLERAARETVTTVNRYSGRFVGIVILRPLLAIIKLRHGLTSITPFQEGGKWNVRLEINPITIVRTEAKEGKPSKLLIEFQYDARWPLDEFVAKATAMQKAAEAGNLTFNVAEQNANQPETSKPKSSTDHLRQGEQARMRNDIEKYITANLSKAKTIVAFSLFAGLDADHLQELQAGGKDERSNMAMVESSMNRSMGAKLRNARKAVNASPEDQIDKVEVNKTPSYKKGGTARMSGNASLLQTLLLTKENYEKTNPKIEVDKIKSWFKLDN
jgi:Domain of unknown function (DUF4157)